MNTASKFNGLNGTIVTRDAIENLLIEAQRNEQTEIVARLEKLLASYPGANKFDFEVTHDAVDEIPKSIIDCLDCELENHEAIFGLGKAVSPNEIYDQITNMVIEMLDKEIDFEQEWNSLESGYNFAYNFVSKKPYRGINQFLLGSKKIYDPTQPLLQNPYYLTFEQIKELKGKLIKGSKAKMVIYYVRLYQYEQAEPKLYFSGYDEKKFAGWVNQNRSKINVLNGSNPLSIESFVNQCLVPILKYYNVFSAIDVEGIDFDLDNFKGKGKIVGIEGKNHDKLEIAEAIISNYPNPAPTLRFGGDRAFYRPSQDLVQMPELKQFNYVQMYYTTFFHELIHSTGSKDRLNRTKGKEFGDKDYAFEELVAELGAMFLCAEAGILHYTKRNSAAYLKSWREALLEEIKNDNRFFFKAASQSQKAVDFMLDRNADGIAAYEVDNLDISNPVPVKKVIKASKTKTESKEEKFLKEYNAIKAKYQKEVVLLRNDNFYIAIGDDAKILYIVLGVEKRTINGNVISGFVASQVDDAKKELVNAGYTVFVSDEIKIEDPVKKKTTVLATNKKSSTETKPKVSKQAKVNTEPKPKNVLENATLIATPLHYPLSYFVYTKKNDLGKNVFFSMINGEIIGKSEYLKQEQAENVAKKWIDDFVSNKKETGQLALFGVKKIDFSKFSNSELQDFIKNNDFEPRTAEETKLFNLANKEFKSRFKKKTKLNGVVDSLVVNAVTNLALGEPEIIENFENVDKDSLAYRMANVNNIVHEYYKIPNPEIAKFLGKVEKKKKESVVITIAGGQGSMKTRLCFQYMNCFAQNYKVGHASIEEHPLSSLYEDKIHDYLDQKALSNIKSPEVSSIDDVHKLIRENDVIVIDSFSKLLEMQKGIGLDKDFRKAYDGKLFIIIYQLTSDGKMRGGSSSQFDGDIISFIEKMPNYEDNYCYHDKNRYNKENLEDLKFNIFSGKLVQPVEEPIAVAPVSNNQFSFQVN